MQYNGGEYDVVVVGAGHAGCEAALASARMGKKTILLTMNLDSVALMPCNPSIGGTGKGHLVREIDALGGEMGKIIDKAMIQCRMLNTAKGPAVHSLRAQADKHRYQMEMKKSVEAQENLTLRQHEVVNILVENNIVKGVITKTGALFASRSVIITTGTYMDSRVVIGDVSYNGGPNGLFPSTGLSNNLRNLKVELMRFKTGTPARIDKKTVDFEKMQIQHGDNNIVPFSFETDKIEIEQVPCYLTYTNEDTHQVIRDNLHLSPLFSGDIKGVGPRYCPSIEDKVTRFADKAQHQIFIEPEGLNTNELYVQGMSSSLPEEVQIKMIKTIAGLENAEIMRSAYAIEYDNLDPTQLKTSLEYKKIDGLFFAGQVNGTSGYEEAGAQGIMAGINAALYIKGEEPLIIGRSEGYIGVLIDDIVTKGISEPYRMMTSRCEYRLLLRQDNADIRLTPKGYEVGLISEERYKRFTKKLEGINNEIERIKKTIIKPTEETNLYLKKVGSSSIKNGISLFELLKRPEVKYNDTLIIDKDRPEISKHIAEEVEIQVKYEGYIEKQRAQVEQHKKMEYKLLPEKINYNDIKGLRIEAKQKLDKIRPLSLGQAARISGVSPADISVVMVYIEQFKKILGDVMEERKLLKECLHELNIDIDELKIDKLLEFMEHVLEVNKNINLTSITDKRDFVLKHIVDSLIMLDNDILFDHVKLLDVGTGGGFPGIPLKIMYPHIDITLMDSVEKKLKFIEQAANNLGIKVDLIHERAENFGRNIKSREKYDIVISRAVANMQTLGELCLPLVKVGGIMITSKGPKCKEEINLAKHALDILGGKVISITNLIIPIEQIERNIVRIKKINSTPKAYPRKPGIPNKNPL